MNLWFFKTNILLKMWSMIVKAVCMLRFIPRGLCTDWQLVDLQRAELICVAIDALTFCAMKERDKIIILRYWDVCDVCKLIVLHFPFLRKLFYMRLFVSSEYIYIYVCICIPRQAYSAT